MIKVYELFVSKQKNVDIISSLLRSTFCGFLSRLQVKVQKLVGTHALFTVKYIVHAMYTLHTVYILYIPLGCQLSM